jgi:polyprenyl-phospho-N-acetylgalactosaminyl synthase
MGSVLRGSTKKPDGVTQAGAVERANVASARRDGRTGVWVVIAAYNEARAIGPVLASVRGMGFNIVVVDDGSSDDSADLARNAGAAVVRHAVNLGQGAALQTGITFALSQGADFIVTFDADGQHRAAHIEHLLASLVIHRADFALGSRFLGEANNIPQSRRLLLLTATWFTRLTTGLAVTDAHNGMRAMTRRGAEAIRLRQNRMAHASEILHQIADSGLKHVEVPVIIDYSHYSIAKGQRSTESINIIVDLFVRRLHP